MRVQVHFFSYFRDLAACSQCSLNLEKGTSLEQALVEIHAKFPNLKAMKKSTLVAVDMEYVSRDHLLCEGNDIALFPPVQGG
jgi:molybdopterin converting factor small subunit